MQRNSNKITMLELLIKQTNGYITRLEKAEIPLENDKDVKLVALVKTLVNQDSKELKIKVDTKQGLRNYLKPQAIVDISSDMLKLGKVRQYELLERYTANSIIRFYLDSYYVASSDEDTFELIRLDLLVMLLIEFNTHYVGVLGDYTNNTWGTDELYTRKNQEKYGKNYNQSDNYLISFLLNTIKASYELTIEDEEQGFTEEGYTNHFINAFSKLDNYFNKENNINFLGMDVLSGEKFGTSSVKDVQNSATYDIISAFYKNTTFDMVKLLTEPIFEVIDMNQDNLDVSKDEHFSSVQSLITDYNKLRIVYKDMDDKVIVKDKSALIHIIQESIKLDTELHLIQLGNKEVVISYLGVNLDEVDLHCAILELQEKLLAVGYDVEKYLEDKNNLEVEPSKFDETGVVADKTKEISLEASIAEEYEKQRVGRLFRKANEDQEIIRSIELKVGSDELDVRENIFKDEQGTELVKSRDELIFKVEDLEEDGNTDQTSGTELVNEVKLNSVEATPGVLESSDEPTSKLEEKEVDEDEIFNIFETKEENIEVEEEEVEEEVEEKLITNKEILDNLVDIDIKTEGYIEYLVDLLNIKLRNKTITEEELVHVLNVIIMSKTMTEKEILVSVPTYEVTKVERTEELEDNEVLYVKSDLKLNTQVLRYKDRLIELKTKDILTKYDMLNKIENEDFRNLVNLYLDNVLMSKYLEETSYTISLMNTTKVEDVLEAIVTNKYSQDRIKIALYLKNNEDKITYINKLFKQMVEHTISSYMLNEDQTEIREVISYLIEQQITMDKDMIDFINTNEVEENTDDLVNELNILKTVADTESRKQLQLGNTGKLVN